MSEIYYYIIIFIILIYYFELIYQMQVMNNSTNIKRVNLTPNTKQGLNVLSIFIFWVLRAICVHLSMLANHFELLFTTYC